MSAPATNNNPFGEQSSETTDFRLTTSQLISEAFDILQMGVEGEEISSDMLRRGMRSLNLMVSTWQAQGLHIWTYDDGTLFLESGKEAYKLQQSRTTNSYWLGRSAAEVLALETLITVTLPLIDFNLMEDIPNSDWNVGIRDNTNTIFWTKVVSWDEVLGELVISDPLPNDVPLNASIYFYRDELRQVERISNVRRVDADVNDTPINFESRQEYFNLPTKKSTGPVSEAYYDRDIPDGTLFIWPVPEDETKIIKFTYERVLFDFINVDDCADLPKYWLEAIVFNLARRLMIKYRIPPDLRNEIKEMAQMTLDEALNFDNEVTNISISLNREAR